MILMEVTVRLWRCLPIQPGVQAQEEAEGSVSIDLEVLKTLLA
jgi:hypothetical protein